MGREAEGGTEGGGNFVSGARKGRKKRKRNEKRPNEIGQQQRRQLLHHPEFDSLPSLLGVIAARPFWFVCLVVVVVVGCPPPFPFMLLFFVQPLLISFSFFPSFQEAQSSSSSSGNDQSWWKQSDSSFLRSGTALTHYDQQVDLSWKNGERRVMRVCNASRGGIRYSPTNTTSFVP